MNNKLRIWVACKLQGEELPWGARVAVRPAKSPGVYIVTLPSGRDAWIDRKKAAAIFFDAGFLPMPAMSQTDLGAQMGTGDLCRF